jgi:hypothetical protein
MSPAEELDKQPTASDAPEAPPESKPNLADSSHLERIRDILFGVQMRDYESRFSRMEQQIAKETATLKEEVRKSIEGLEDFVRRELDLLDARLNKEGEERADSDRKLSGELRSASESLSARITHIEQIGFEAQRRLHDELFQQSKNLRDEARASQDQILATIESRIQDLKGAKIDRANLASMLTEMAMKLSGEFRIPER